MGGKRRGVSARGSGIQITFPLQGERRREQLKLPPTERNLAYAELKRGQIMLEIELGSFDYASHFPDSHHARGLTARREATVSQRAALWLKTRVLTETSRARYLRAVRKHIDERRDLGPRPIAKVLSSELELWRAELAGALRPKTVNNLLTVLRGAFELAQADGVLDKNPAARLRNVENAGATDVDPFTADELRALLTEFDGAQHNMIDFWWTTGLRAGELWGLEWRDIDWRKQTAHVRRALVEGKEVEVKTKRKGQRLVKLNALALAALQRQRAHTELQGSKIFMNPDTGSPWSHAVVLYRKWQRACRRAKVRFRPPKQLRHTYASMSLSAGEPPLFVAAQLGHTSLQMLERHYAQWMPTVNRAAGEGFEAAARQVSGATAATQTASNH